MKQILKVGLALGIVAVVLLLAYRELQRNLFTGMTSDKIADVVTWNSVNFIIGACLVLVVVFVVWAIRQSRQEPRQIENVEADYRVLTPRAPVVQLPARTISIPRNTANGTAQPWGMQAQPRPQPTIETVNDMGEHIGVPLNFLFRFLALPTPARSEWTGKREMYSQCLELCNAQGLLNRQANGGSKWKPEYPLESRKQWALQFEQDGQPIDAEYTRAREE